MKYFKLITASLWRKPLRTTLTGASLLIAFMLFGLLEPVAQLFSGGTQASGETRLWVAPRHSISDMLPVHYHQQVQQIEGVDTAAHQTWFGGVYIDAVESSTFTRWAITPREFMQINPQLTLPEEQLEAFINTRTGVIVGRSIAQRYNMEIGDRIPITADIWHNQDGSQWEFDIVGIYDAAEGETVNTTRLFINYDFFDEYRIVGKGLVSNILFTVHDSRQTAPIAASIDARFANSEMETYTTTEQEYVLNQISQLGNIGLIVRAIMGAVFFTMLLLTANTMSQAVRERSAELAVLKTLGFSDNSVLLIVLAEALLLALTAAATGLGLAAYLLQFGEYVIPQITTLNLNTDTILLGLLVAFALALVVGLPPAVRAMRLNIADALVR
ncbi:MAG: ABC transporter permease [Pseudohongiella sp.]|uniref:ABC transporter permease n=1 Tax=Pseudohongiella sp. TaxID=1979412 RepID=UPI0034A06E0D